MQIRFGLKYLEQRNDSFLALWRPYRKLLPNGQFKVDLYPVICPVSAYAKVVRYHTLQLWIEELEDRIDLRRFDDWYPLEHLHKMQKKLKEARDCQHRVKQWLFFFLRLCFPGMDTNHFLNHVVTYDIALLLEKVYNSGLDIKPERLSIWEDGLNGSMAPNNSDDWMAEVENEMEKMDEENGIYSAFDPGYDMYMEVNYRLDRTLRVAMKDLWHRMSLGSFSHYKEGEYQNRENMLDPQNRWFMEHLLYKLECKLKRLGHTGILVDGRKIRVVGQDLLHENNRTDLKYLVFYWGRLCEPFLTPNFDCEHMVEGTTTKEEYATTLQEPQTS